MDYLLDTHILLWALAGEDRGGSRLPVRAREILLNSGNNIYFSSVNVFEIELKRIVKPNENLPTGEDVVQFCHEAGFQMLPLRNEHALMMKTLRKEESVKDHKDPYDWLLCVAG